MKCVIADLTDAELKIKQMYCDDILSVLDALGSGDSIKKGVMREIGFSSINKRIFIRCFLFLRTKNEMYRRRRIEMIVFFFPISCNNVNDLI